MNRYAIVLTLASIAMPSAAPAVARHHLATLRFHQGGRFSVAATTRYPHFTDTTPLARLANRVLERWARTDQADFAREVRELHEDDPRPAVRCAYDARSIVVRDESGKLVSVLVNRFRNLGGAHPIDEYLTFNFGMIGGRPKRITLSDLFQPGSNHRSVVTKLLIDRLKNDPNAVYARDGSLTRFTDEQLNRFTIPRSGLTFYINPYEAAPYAAGRFKIVLSAADLGPTLRWNLLAGDGLACVGLIGLSEKLTLFR